MGTERESVLNWGHYQAELIQGNESLKSLNLGLKRIKSPYRFYLIRNLTAEEMVTKGLFSETSLLQFYRNICWDFKNHSYKFPVEHQVFNLDNTGEICYSDLIPFENIRGLLGQTLSALYLNPGATCYRVNLDGVRYFWNWVMQDLPVQIGIRQIPSENSRVWFDVRIPYSSAEVAERIRMNQTSISSGNLV